MNLNLGRTAYAAYLRFGGRLVLILLLCVLPSCSQRTCPNLMEKVWLHSHEEDSKNGSLVFRPKTFNFPATRGPRDGFFLKQGGALLLYGVGKSDKGSTGEGTWSVSDTTLLRFHVTTGTVEYRLMKCDSDLLILRLNQ